MRSKCSNSSRQQNNESFSISQMSLGSGEWIVDIWVLDPTRTLRWMVELELAVGSNARQVNKHTAIWDHHLFNFWKGNSDVVLSKKRKN